MKEYYYGGSKGVTIDLMLSFKEKGALITRVEVNRAFRGKGYASEMMKEVIKDADEAGITLFLSVDPDGTGLTKIQLQRWYFRLGFERFPGTDMQGAVQKTKEVKQCQEERSFTGDGSSPYLIPQIKGVQICI